MIEVDADRWPPETRGRSHNFARWDELAAHLTAGRMVLFTPEEIAEAKDLRTFQLYVMQAMKRRGLRVDTRQSPDGLYVRARAGEVS